MKQWVEVSFDCLPLRSVTRMDIPIDASPVFRARCERILAAVAKHGSLNTYYLHNAACKFHLTNRDDLGAVGFQFEGTALTDSSDQKTLSCDLQVDPKNETCDWLTEPVVAWFAESVRRAVAVEFDRFIAAGDLTQTVERIEKLQRETDSQDGFVGMYL